VAEFSGHAVEPMPSIPAMVGELREIITTLTNPFTGVVGRPCDLFKGRMEPISDDNAANPSSAFGESRNSSSIKLT